MRDRFGLAMVFSAAVLLSGCAGTGPNQAVGTGVGAVGGYAVGTALGGGPAGRAVGAVAGALIGGSVGQSMDHQQLARSAPPPAYGYPSTFSECLNWAPGPERYACERGVRQRLAEDQRRREYEAYRSGLGR